MALPTPDPNGWHLKKEIQLGHLVTTIAVALSAVMYINKLDQRITLIEQKVADQKEQSERELKMTADSMSLLRGQLDRMDSKLDRIIESKR